MTPWRIAGGMALMITLTVIANLLMKSGASVPTAARPILGMVAWQSCAGIAAFGGAAVIYAWVLQWLPLNVAQSFAAFQFVAVIFAAAAILAEPIPVLRWVGIGLIAVGILIVGFTSDIRHESDASKPYAVRPNV